MALAVEEVLSLWRDLERLREEFPSASVERQRIESEIDNLREVYARITANGEATDTALRASRDAIERARAVLARAQTRIPEPTGTD